MDISKLTEIEVKFLEENQAVKNEHGVYLFISQNGQDRISLDFYLLEYKNWLIENKIVKPY